MRRSRRWRWVLVGAVVALGLFFALDVVFVQYLESRGGAEIARTMAAEDSEIDLGGIPFIPRYLGGTLSGVSSQVRGASAAGGLRVQSVEARMEYVHFAPGKMFSLARSIFSTNTDVRAENVIVILELGEGDLGDFIRRHIPVVGDVQVKGSGIEVRFLKEDVDPADAVRPSEDDLTPPARLLPTARDRRLRLVLLSFRGVPARYRAEVGRLETLIELPQFPEGLEPDVSMRDGVIVVEAQGAEVTVEVGEAPDADDPDATASP